MAAERAAVRSRLLESLMRLSAGVVGVVHTRLQLLALELEEERRHFFALLILILFAGFCLGLALALATTLLLVAYWDNHRLLVLVTLVAIYAVAGLAAVAWAVVRIRHKSTPSAASLGELRADGRQLVGKL